SLLHFGFHEPSLQTSYAGSRRPVASATIPGLFFFGPSGCRPRSARTSGFLALRAVGRAPRGPRVFWPFGLSAALRADLRFFRVLFVSDMSSLVVRPIGFVRSPFREKADAPRQATVGRDVLGEVEILPEYTDGLCDLEGFDRIWLVFWFDR